MIFNDKEITKVVQDLLDRYSSMKTQIAEIKAIAESKISEDEATSRELTTKIENLHTTAESKSQEIENIIENIKEINAQYNDNKAKFDTAIQTAEDIHEKKLELQTISEEIASEHSKILLEQNQANTNLATIQGIEKKINTYAANSEDSSKKIDELLLQAQKNSDAVERLHEQIYGKDTTDSTGTVTHKEGLKDKLAVTYDKLSADMKELSDEFVTFKSSITSSFDEFMDESIISKEKLIDEIRSYLPDAVTAGLAGAYEEKRKTETAEMEKSSFQFKIVVVVMVVIAFIPFGLYGYWLYSGMPINDILALAPNTLTLILPFYGPLIWIGLHINRKVNLSKKLVEEYAYKEAISKSITGMKEQIKILEDPETYEKLHIKLIELILEASADNPGKHITGHNKSDNPLVEISSGLLGFERLVSKSKEAIPSLQEILNKNALSANSVDKVKSEDKA